jgi:glutamate-1-semialdehyde aminotransferase
MLSQKIIRTQQVLRRKLKMTIKEQKISLEEVQSNETSRNMLKKLANEIRGEFNEICKEKGVSPEVQTLAMMNNFILFVKNNVTEYNPKGGE